MAFEDIFKNDGPFTSLLCMTLVLRHPVVMAHWVIVCGRLRGEVGPRAAATALQQHTS